MRESRRKNRRVRRGQVASVQAAPTQPRREVLLLRLVALLLVVAGIVSYHNALNGPFLMDDLPAISRNPTIRAFWSSAVLSPPINTAVTGRPVVNLSLAFNYALSGLDVTSYHVFNLALHILVALALFAVCRQILRAPRVTGDYKDEATWIASAIALLWVVHPLTSESVDYTIQRTELLMGFFFLLTFACAIRSFEARKRWRWYGAAFAAFILGLGSKEVIAVAPAAVFTCDWLFWSGSPKAALRRHGRLYVGYLVVLALFVLAVGTRLRRAFTGLTRHMSPWDYALTQSGVIVHYLRLAIWPRSLAADYDGWPIATSISDVLPWLAIVAALLALTIWGLVRQWKLAFLGAWFFLILAPTSSFRPMPIEVAAERRMYLPLMAVIALAVLGGRELLRRVGAPAPVAAGSVLVLAAVLTGLTTRRNADYRTPLAFWSDIVSKRPDNPRGRMGLGYYLYKQGRAAESLTQLAEAVRVHPENGEARYSYGVVLASQGKTDDAIAQYREAIRIDPNHPRARFNFARALTSQGRKDEAIEQLEVAVRLNPNFTVARRLLDNLRGTPMR
jgi:tetratricopeptide (TPR) repeat protein